MNTVECALVEAEALRITEEAAIRRWLSMPFSSGTHWIGLVLVSVSFVL